MPSFSFSTINKKNKAKANNSKAYKTNVKGVIWIDINGRYYVISKDDKNNEVNYFIHESSYSCKGIEKIYYTKIKDGRRLSWIRLPDDRIEAGINWLPFAVGCLVAGNIVRNDIGLGFKFVIKKCLLDPRDEEGKKAYKWYCKNYSVIMNNIKNKNANVR